MPITGFANAIVAPAIEFKTDESDIIGLSQKAFKHLDASMMI
ncbi:MAG: SpoVA/SpoVAEb family sporulation membrane protein [Dethiobacteria bacterium]